jgi:hypothetical protein
MTLGKATLIALAVAVVVLVAAVLPAEYGIDPTGIGEATGMLDLYAAGATMGSPAAAVITADPAGPLVPQTAKYKTDKTAFTLPPGGSIEYKYQLAEGAGMVYTWQATGDVEFDFHTEPEGKGAAGSESFEKGESLAGHGTYRARYPGIHGFYWRNLTRDEVTVTITSAGFYSEARQIREDGTTRAKYPEDVR